MNAEIVPVDTSSEVSLTSYLQRARDWLATAVETSGPEQIANAKAELATAAEATKQLGLSKEIRDDALEMVRRAEYALGKAVRKGQAEGSLRKNGQRGSAQRSFLRVRNGREEFVQGAATDQTSSLGSPKDFLGNGQEANEIYTLVDNLNDEEFEGIISEAKAEGNLTRANLARKARKDDGHQTRDQRADMIRKLADKGWSSAQMTNRVGISEQTIRQIGRDYGIHIPADRALNKQRRLNPDDVVDNIVIGLEGSVMSLALISLNDIDRERAADWATSLHESLKELNRFAKRIKEMTQ